MRISMLPKSPALRAIELILNYGELSQQRVLSPSDSGRVDKVKRKESAGNLTQCQRSVKKESGISHRKL